MYLQSLFLRLRKDVRKLRLIKDLNRKVSLAFHSQDKNFKG